MSLYISCCPSTYPLQSSTAITGSVLLLPLVFFIVRPSLAWPVLSRLLLPDGCRYLYVVYFPWSLLFVVQIVDQTRHIGEKRRQGQLPVICFANVNLPINFIAQCNRLIPPVTRDLRKNRVNRNG